MSRRPACRRSPRRPIRAKGCSRPCRSSSLRRARARAPSPYGPRAAGDTPSATPRASRRTRASRARTAMTATTACRPSVPASPTRAIPPTSRRAISSPTVRTIPTPRRITAWRRIPRTRSIISSRAISSSISSRGISPALCRRTATITPNTTPAIPPCPRSSLPVNVRTRRASSRSCPTATAS